MSEIVERVARSICSKEIGKICDCAKNNRVICEDRIGLAKAAILAMREPTDAMARVYPTDWDAVTPEDVWKAMIDEALK